MAELNQVKRPPADQFPNAAFARPGHREQSADAGTTIILAFDGATARAIAETANSQFEDKSRAHNV